MSKTTNLIETSKAKTAHLIKALCNDSLESLTPDFIESVVDTLNALSHRLTVVENTVSKRLALQEERFNTMVSDAPLNRAAAAIFELNIIKEAL